MSFEEFFSRSCMMAMTIVVVWLTSALIYELDCSMVTIYIMVIRL
jgi:hypothetical protein